MGGGSAKSAVQKELRIVILGLDNSGKTTILRKLAKEDIQMIEPTQGFNAKSLPGPKGSRLVCFDVGGQIAIRGHWSQYFVNSQALVFVVDAADPKRLDEVSAELSLCLDDSKLSGVPVLIFANKQDLATALQPQEICDKLKLWTIRDHTWEIKGCSALEGTGINEGIDWICSKIQK